MQAEDKIENYNVYQVAYNYDTKYNYLGGVSFVPNDGVLTEGHPSVGVTNTIQSNSILIENYIGFNDGTYVISKGDTVRVSVQNIQIGIDIYDVLNDVMREIHSPTSLGIYVYYTDGSVESVATGEYVASSYPNIDVSFEFKANKDVEKFMFSLQYDISQYVTSSAVDVTVHLGEWRSKDDTNVVSLKIEDVNTGLLAGILGKLQEVKDNISNVITSITELPQKIWSFIENGLKSLFVPDEQYIVEYKDKWDTLLENKLGAVYEVANVTFESWELVRVSDEQDTIQMPKVTIPLPDDNEFSFGGYDVKIVPDGFGFLVTSLKIITAVVCTIAFVNGLRKRYDEVMGVEQ